MYDEMKLLEQDLEEYITESLVNRYNTTQKTRYAELLTLPEIREKSANIIGHGVKTIGDFVDGVLVGDFHKEEPYIIDELKWAVATHDDDGRTQVKRLFQWSDDC